MFETATLSYGQPTNRVWATAMGFTGQALLIGCALLAPLISPQTLGRAFLVTALVPPTAPPPPPPPGPKVIPRASVAPVTQFREGKIFVPTNVPRVPQIFIDPAPDLTGGGGGVPGGVIGGPPNGIVGGMPRLIEEIAGMVPLPRLPEVAAHSPAPAPVPTAPVKPPRVTQLQMATPIQKVEPVYPPLAKQARVSGTVELLGVLGTDGRIHELKVLRGHPLLITAALDAVRQWVFAPTMLNGQPVEVAAPIIVNFILN